MPARLHHERIARTGTEPARWLAITHGIYGAGSNWRGIARKINERRPEWGIVLVDLRQHGRSEPGDPPHTVAACAEDVAALFRELGAASGGNISAFAGHSFGGKVALATRAIVDLDQTWVLDASPSPRPGALEDPDNSVVRVLDLMTRLPGPWTTRDQFVAALVAEGQTTELAKWLAMNLVPAPRSTDRLVPGEAVGSGSAEPLVNRLDLGAIRELLADYYALDLRDAALARRGALELVIASRSSAVPMTERARLPLRAPGMIREHYVDAGHWLHIEAPAAVVNLFVEYLP